MKFPPPSPQRRKRGCCERESDEECCGYGHPRDFMECTTAIQRVRAEAAESQVRHLVDSINDEIGKRIKAEKALAEVQRLRASHDSMLWRRVYLRHQVLGNCDDLRAELEKMKSDRDQFADEADDLRAKLEEARAVVGRVATERDELRAKLSDELTPRHISDGWRADRERIAGELVDVRSRPWS